MPPVQQIPGPGGAQQPSNFEKFKMGTMMGASVGAVLGLMFGTMTIFQHGAGEQGVMRTLGKFMLTSGGSFSLFLGIGSVIRSEEHALTNPRHPAEWQALYRQAVIQSRSERH